MFEVKLVGEETFSFTSPGEPVINILSGRLRTWLLEKAMDKVIDLTFPEQPLDEIVQMHGLEAPRMKSMTLFEAQEPVIVGLQPTGTHILIDGGHRRWFWAARGQNVIRGWAVPTEVWSSFTFNPDDCVWAKHHADGSLLPQRRAR